MKTKFKIAFINTYGNGSTGNIVNSLKQCCINNDIEAHSYFSRCYCATPETSTRIYSKFGFYYDALMTRIFDNHGLNSKGNTKKLIKELAEYKPDIIHIHNLHGYWVNYEMLFSYIKRNHIKVVFTLHDCWSFTGHCTHFDFVKCEKWKTGCYECPQKKLYPKGYFFDGSKRNFEKKKNAFCSLDKNDMVIVTPSKWLKTNVDKSFLNKFECVVINNGVDIEVFKPLKKNIKSQLGYGDRKLVLAVANYWDERKGLDFFIELARMKPDWDFIYIGKEKKVINDIPNNVLHIERTDSQRELAQYYSAADVFVNPSLEETYSTTNLEAIACGTPVVTYRSGGCPEIVEKTGFGVVSKERTAKSLLEGIEKLEHMNIPSHQSTVSSVSSDIQIQMYIDLYKRLFL